MMKIFMHRLKSLTIFETRNTQERSDYGNSYNDEEIFRPPARRADLSFSAAAGAGCSGEKLTPGTVHTVNHKAPKM